MYFNFDGRNFDTPTVESAMSWREKVLLSLFVHGAVVLLAIFIPQLSFVQKAVERRAERLAEITEQAELQAQARAQEQAEDARRFVFVQPRIEVEPPESPERDAPLSDRDRVAESPLQSQEPENRLPVADGNSSEFIVSEQSDDGLNPEDSLELDEPVELDESAVGEPRLADVSSGQGERAQAPELSDNPGTSLEADATGDNVLADSSLLRPGTGPSNPDDEDELEIDVSPEGFLGAAVDNLRRSVRRQTFRNFSGDTGRFGPEIEFDTKGVEFGPWIRRFVAQIRRNWFLPYAMWSEHGNVVLTFNVHRSGALTDLSVSKPARVEAFTNSAANALRASNPTQPLPLEYPDDHAFFTVTFYFNELPPAQ